jgi:uncharacterized protein DUF4430
VRRLAPFLLVLAVAGCGGTAAGKGHAMLWVTRDRGAHVLLVRTVPAGLTAMQALDRAATIQTRYGGRYVQSIQGIDGSLSGQSDWFYFVNGIEGDRSAAEYRLHPGDVEWWDYRSWRSQMRQPVVVGAFPEPFLHGYGGTRRPAVVVGSGAGVRALAHLLHARILRAAPAGANVLRVADGSPRFTARPRSAGGVEFTFAGDARRLARHPGLFRFRYEVP